MTRLAWFFLAVLFIVPSTPAPAEREHPTFEARNLQIVPDSSGLGGTLVLKREGAKDKEIYSFDREIDFLPSPHGTLLAINDKTGVQFFSIIIVDSSFRKAFLDHAVDEKLPIVKKFSSIYRLAIRWLSEDELLVEVEAHGALEQTLREPMNDTTVRVKIPGNLFSETGPGSARIP